MIGIRIDKLSDVNNRLQTISLSLNSFCQWKVSELGAYCTCQFLTSVIERCLAPRLQKNEITIARKSRAVSAAN